MNTAIEPRERFRKGFVLVMTLAYASMFFAMISGFVEELLLAAVFSGIVYPLFMTVLAIYSRVFADWLNPDQQSVDQASQ